MVENTFKVVLWLGIALAIDFAVDPLWSSLATSMYGPSYFASWSTSVSFMYFHLLPYAISNALEALIYAWLKQRGII